MPKSILSVFRGAAGLILKVMLVLVLIFAAGYCLITMFMESFLWGGALRAGICAAKTALYAAVLPTLLAALRRAGAPKEAV